MSEIVNSVNSASDGRTVNNAVRHQYRILGDEEKAQMLTIKDLGAAFIEQLHKIGGTPPDGERFGSRNLALAFGHVEDAVYRAVKHITA